MVLCNCSLNLTGKIFFILNKAKTTKTSSLTVGVIFVKISSTMALIRRSMSLSAKYNKKMNVILSQIPQALYISLYACQYQTHSL